MRCVIFDIDGTLSDASHLLHHVTGGNRDWPAFFAAMGDDPLIRPIAELLANLDAMNNPIVLYMRPAGDTRPDHVVKAELLARMREEGYEPWLAIDDRPTIVAMWRENGITCLQCRDWGDPAKIAPGLLTIMVGPSGAGKTTWLAGHYNGYADFAGPSPTDLGIRPRHIISSDEIREDLCGDFRSQERNDEVFAALHAIVKARISRGLPAVVDATHLRRRDRMAVAALAPNGAAVRYIVLDRTMEAKYRDAGWRAEIKDKDGRPFDLIAKHAATFNSQIKDILVGDSLPNVTVLDLR